MHAGRSCIEVRTASRSIRNHRRFIRFLRFLFPFVAFIIAASLLLWPQLVKQKSFIDSLLKVSPLHFSTKANIDMTKVQFFSEDEKGQPFTIVSEKVLETDPDQQLVRMDNPKGEMTLNSGVKILTSSPFGLFYQGTQILVFNDKVKITTDNGYEGNLSHVTLYHKKKSAESPYPIAIEGPKGSLAAEGFKMWDNGDKIDFFGNSKLIVKQPEAGETVIVTSQKGLEVRQTEKTLTAKGNAVLTRADNQLYADKIIGFYEEVTRGKYELQSIKAVGHVKIVTPTETITGNDAFYNMVTEKAFITGAVHVERQEGEMSGDRAVVDMKKGSSQLEVDRKLPNTGGRVRGILLPTQIKKDKVK